MGEAEALKVDSLCITHDVLLQGRFQSVVGRWPESEYDSLKGGGGFSTSWVTGS